MFATKQESDGTLTMTYPDFLRTLTPFNYSEIKTTDDVAAYLERHGDRLKPVMRIADPDGDGAVDFTEFLFFITVQ